MNQLLFSSLRDVLKALEVAGIASMIVKDASVALTAYPELRLRPISEVEVLVRYANVAAATRALEDAGWQRSIATRRPEIALGSNSGLRFASAAPTGAVVLRAHPMTGAVVGGVSNQIIDDLWDGAVAASVEDVPSCAPSPADELVYTCISGVSGRWWRTIQWVADATMILRRDGAIDWPRLLRMAEDQGLIPPLRDAFTYLTRLLDAPIPDVWQRQIRQAPVARRDIVAHRIASRGGRIAGSLPSLIGHYIRGTRTQHPMRAIAGVSPYIKKAWGLDHWWDVPATATRAVVQRLQPRRRHPGGSGRATTHAGAPPDDRTP